MYPNYLNGFVLIFKMDCNIKVSYIIALENIIHFPFFLPTELLC